MENKIPTGLVFDNNRGIYMGQAIIELAESFGMTEEVERTPEHEFYCEAWEDAENWLNRFVAEEGFSFGSGECGDFFYMPNSHWEEGNDEI